MLDPDPVRVYAPPLPGSGGSDTLGPVKLPHVHVGLDDGDDYIIL